MPSTTSGGLPIPLDSDPFGDGALALRNLAGAFDTTAGWTNVTGLNSWVSFGAPYQLPQYKRTGDRVKHRGVMKNGTVGSPMYNVPVGYRPPASLILNSPYTNTGPGRLEIDASGNVTLIAGGNGFIGLAFDYERA